MSNIEEPPLWSAGYEHGWRDAHDLLTGPAGQDDQTALLAAEIAAAMGEDGDAPLGVVARWLIEQGWRNPTDAGDESREASTEWGVRWGDIDDVETDSFTEAGARSYVNDMDDPGGVVVFRRVGAWTEVAS